MHNDLERSLHALRDHVEMPAAQDLSSAVMAALETPAPSRRAWWTRPAFALAAVIVLGLAVTLVLSAPVREAVADLLGIGGVRIEFVESSEGPTPKLSPSGLDLGDEATLAEARAELPVGVPAALGKPDAVYVDHDPPTRVSLVYAPRPGLPEAEETGVGLVLTQFRSQLDEGLIKKLVDAKVEVRFVDVNGHPAYWIEGPHDLLVLEAGGVASDEARLAGNTLVWDVDGVTLRLEADIEMEEAIEIAESID